METVARYLAVRTVTFDLGFEALRVQRVVAAGEWGEIAAEDLETLLGIGTPGAPRHVLVFETTHGPRKVSTSCDLFLRECASGDVHDLPTLLWQRDQRSPLASIAVLDDQPPLLILSRDVLATLLPAETSPGDAPP